MNQYDLIIVGGGLVGAGLAIALQSMNLRIALIDARRMTGDDPRLFALNASSCQFLENLGVWEQLQTTATAIQQVHISYKRRFGSVRLLNEDAGLPALGYLVPAATIETVLNNALTKLNNLTLFRPATLKELKQREGMNILFAATETGNIELSSPMVIGADGADSVVRTQMKIAAQELYYGQSAIVTKTTLQKHHQHIAYERFTESGAIAMLPFGERQCATIWSAKDEKVNELMSQGEEQFLQTLQNEFGYRLGRLLNIGKRFIFPLRMVCAENSCVPGMMLIGNAAHTLHPIAAQGFNLAIYEVAALVEEIMDKITANDPLSSIDLTLIHKNISKQKTKSVRFSHQLATLVATKSPFSSFALQLGMVGMNACLPIKKYFIQQMMGRTECVPRLLLNTRELLSVNGL